MFNYYQTILESSRRCAVATQEVAGNARTAADQISVQAIELEAMAKAIEILSKTTGVRTEPSDNPVPPPSPVSFLQVQ